MTIAAENKTLDLFGPVIFAYTRAQAFEDGVLADLNEVAPEACGQFRFPIACTTAVWEVVDKAVKNKKWCNDYEGVVHDMLWMSRAHSRALDPTSRLFKVIIRGAGRKTNYVFKIVCGPGDNAEPVMTIMLPNED